MILVQISKLFLVLLAAVVYVGNDDNNSAGGWARHASLFVIMVLSWIVAGICIFTDFYKPKGYTMFFRYALGPRLG